MPLLKPSLQKQVRESLGGLTGPVKIVVFTTDTDQHACEMCDDTRQLIEEVAWLSDGRITTEIYNLVRDAERAQAYHVDQAPAVVVLGVGPALRDHGIRFFGIPSGYEFASLIAAIVMVSSGETSLTAETREALSRVTEPLHIRVFVTPTCPYCPSAVTLAHELAMASPHITAEMIDASEFPELADRYNVHAVPRTVINDTVHIEGAVAQEAVVAKLERWSARQLQTAIYSDYMGSSALGP
jgi:glutaredoxin-like protein